MSRVMKRTSVGLRTWRSAAGSVRPSHLLIRLFGLRCGSTLLSKSGRESAERLVYPGAVWKDIQHLRIDYDDVRTRAYLAAVTPRTAAEKSYSGRIVSRLSFRLR